MNFQVFFQKQIRYDQTFIDWTPEPINVPEELKLKILAHWKMNKKNHFNGVIARLDKWCLKKDKLYLYLRPTRYQHLLFSNDNVDFTISNYGEKYLSHALGISVILNSKDDYLVYILRSRDVGEYPELFDIPGGHIDIDSTKNAQPNVFQAVKREIQEEVSIDTDDLMIKIIGLIQVKQTLKPELIFHAKSKLSGKEIQKAVASNLCKEYSELFVSSNKVLEEHLNYKKHRWTPSALGAFQILDDIYKNRNTI
jgi:hypothetical protein